MALQVINAARPGNVLPNPIIGSYFTLNSDGKRPTVNLCALRNTTGDGYFIQTEVFNMRSSPIKQTETDLLFICTRDELPHTVNVIENLEGLVNKSLTNEDIKIPANLMMAIKNCNGKVLRPSVNADEKIFLRTTPDTKYYNWDGNAISPNDLKRGKYQLIIRASNIYFGQHGQSNYPASVQLKVIQVRYDDSVPYIEPTSLFMFTNSPQQIMKDLPPFESFSNPLSPTKDLEETLVPSTKQKSKRPAEEEKAATGKKRPRVNL